MISTISDLLEQFKSYALSKIEKDEQDVTHRPTIGNIFEGLTSELLNRSIFDGLGLKIVEKSFIYGETGKMTGEIDCMLVVGDGVQISFTNQYKYHIKDVIAVFQVKKNLYANDIDDAHQNLHSVLDISEPKKSEEYMRVIHRDAYKLLTSKDIPDTERLARFTDRENFIYHLLMMEAYHPLRIVIGYYGYTTEFGLREGFVKKLEEISKNGPAAGYNPVSFPSLFICGNSTIVKSNGMPYGIPFTDKEFYWDLFTSSTGRPMYHLLELIWTRLAYRFEINSDVFGDDFDIEAAHPFISCKEKKIGPDSWGWEYMYHPLSQERLEKPLISIPWTPTEIDKNKFSILTVLSRVGVVDIKTDEQFLKFVKDEGIDSDKIIGELVNDKLVYVDEDKMGLLVDELIMVVAPNGKTYAGENKNQQMTNYFGKS